MNRAEILQEASEVGFDGATYSHALDGSRLTGLMGRVFDCVKDGRWWSLCQLSIETGGSEGGCAARLRDLRKERFGAFNIERKRATVGVFHYYRLKGKVAPAQVLELAKQPVSTAAQIFDLLNRPALVEQAQQPANDTRLQVAVEALQRIAAGEGAPREGAAPFPKWAQMQELAKKSLREIEKQASEVVE